MPFKPYKPPTTRVKFTGTFDYFEIYRFMLDYVRDALYSDAKRYRFQEDYWSEVWSEKGREIWFWWKTYKIEDKNQFYKLNLNYVFHLKKIKDVEVLIDGKKVAAHRGEMSIFITPILEFDPDKKWDEHWLLKNELIQQFFLYKLWLKRRNLKMGTILKDQAKVQSQIKRFFELQPFTGDMQDDFFKSMGLKERYDYY